MQSLQFRSQSARGNVDSVAGIIRNVSVVTIGTALGHGFEIDAKTLETVKAAAGNSSVKVKVNHGTGADAIIGSLRNFRIMANQVIADLHLLKSNPFCGRILEMAREIPETFGLSISFSYVPEKIADKTFVRVTALDSVDIVDSPAANAGGLFSALSAVTPLTGRAKLVAAFAADIAKAAPKPAALSETLTGHARIVADINSQLNSKKKSHV